MRIAVAIASHDMVPFLFAYDLGAMMTHTAANLPEGWSLGLHGVSGTYIHKARIDLINVVREGHADAVLFLDSDMRFPRQALIHLLNHNVNVVGANYAQRYFPSDYTAIKKIGMGGAGQKVETLPESTGLEEAEALGFGCILIRAEALKNLPDPEEVPWFQNEYLGGNRWMGEDVFFCKLLREAGEKLYVDHDLSKQVMHVGQYEYDFMAPEFSRMMAETAEEVKERINVADN